MLLIPAEAATYISICWIFIQSWTIFKWNIIGKFQKEKFIYTNKHLQYLSVKKTEKFVFLNVEKEFNSAVNLATAAVIIEVNTESADKIIVEVNL